MCWHGRICWSVTVTWWPYMTKRQLNWENVIYFLHHFWVNIEDKRNTVHFVHQLGSHWLAGWNIFPVKKMTPQRKIQELNNNDMQYWCKRAQSPLLQMSWNDRRNCLKGCRKRVANLPWNCCLTWSRCFHNNLFLFESSAYNILPKIRGHFA